MSFSTTPHHAHHHHHGDADREAIQQLEGKIRSERTTCGEKVRWLEMMVSHHVCLSLSCLFSLSPPSPSPFHPIASPLPSPLSLSSLFTSFPTPPSSPVPLLCRDVLMADRETRQSQRVCQSYAQDVSCLQRGLVTCSPSSM